MGDSSVLYVTCFTVRRFQMISYNFALIKTKKGSICVNCICCWGIICVILEISPEATLWTYLILSIKVLVSEEKGINNLLQ